MGLSTALAAPSFRARLYEVFKTTHVVLAAVALAAVYQYVIRYISCRPTLFQHSKLPLRHVKTIFNGMYKFCVCVCVGIWAADYMCRFLRIVWMNLIRNYAADAVANFSEEAGIISLLVTSL